MATAAASQEELGEDFVLPDTFIPLFLSPYFHFRAHDSDHRGEGDRGDFASGKVWRRQGSRKSKHVFRSIKSHSEDIQEGQNNKRKYQYKKTRKLRIRK